MHRWLIWSGSDWTPSRLCWARETCWCFETSTPEASLCDVRLSSHGNLTQASQDSRPLTSSHSQLAILQWSLWLSPEHPRVLQRPWPHHHRQSQSSFPCFLSSRSASRTHCSTERKAPAQNLQPCNRSRRPRREPNTRTNPRFFVDRRSALYSARKVCPRFWEGRRGSSSAGSANPDSISGRLEHDSEYKSYVRYTCEEKCWSCPSELGCY